MKGIDFSMSEIEYGIAWSDSYRLGNAQVDSQHRTLFELLSKLVSACQDGTDTVTLQETLEFLANYTVLHFNDEESLQIQYNYPDFPRHKQLHEDFKDTVGIFVQDFRKNGSSEELSKIVNKIVVRWLINHIQQEDKKIGRHIDSILK